MTMRQGALAPHLDRFVDALHAARGLDDVRSASGALFRQMEMPIVNYVGVPSSRSGLRMFDTSGTGWSEHYGQRGYAAIDPFIHEVCRGTTPRVGGVNIDDGWRMASSETQRIADEAAAFGFRAIYFIPVEPHGPRGFGGMVLAGNCAARPFLRRLRACSGLMRLAAAQAHEAVRRIDGCALAAGIALSAREIDCLSHLASGMRISRIAERLGLADVTVEAHVHSARRKLGASTRDQAVARAVATGLIVP